MDRGNQKHPVEWKDAMSLEEWIRDRFEKNREGDLIETLKLLPANLREKCRSVWIEETNKRRKKNGIQ